MKNLTKEKFIRFVVIEGFMLATIAVLEVKRRRQERLKKNDCTAGLLDPEYGQPCGEFDLEKRDIFDFEADGITLPNTVIVKTENIDE